MIKKIKKTELGALKNCLINTLIKAESFRDAEEIVSILSTYSTFSREQINKIFIFAIQNNQFRICKGGHIFWSY
jgi:hypothetical protein